MSNLTLELEALKTVQQEYRDAVSSDQSLFILMEIKMRLENMRALCIEDMKQMLDPVG